MKYEVVFSPEAETQLNVLEDYIANASGSAQVAANYTDAIVVHCESFSTFPNRGISRNDLRAGLRMTSFKNTVIAYSVDGNIVTIIGIFTGGQNYVAILLASLED